MRFTVLISCPRNRTLISTLKMASIFLLSALLLGSQTFAATYYMAPAGDDSNTCEQAASASKPKKTFASALPCLTPGDELVLKDGTYPKTSHGQLNASCSSGKMKKGLGENQRITVRAEHDRKAHLVDDGNSLGVVQVSWCDYWTIQGLHISGVQNANATVNANIGIRVAAADHVIVRRNLIHDLNHHVPSVGIGFRDSASHGLIEENEVYNFNGHLIYALKVSHITFRRNYGWGKPAAPGTGPHVSFLAYLTTDSIFENNIAENTLALSGGGDAAAFGDTGARNRFLGNIAVGSRNGFSVAKHPVEYMKQEDSIFENNVAIGINGQGPMSNGLLARSAKNTQVKNMSIFGAVSNGVYANNQYDPRNGWTSEGGTQQSPGLTVVNTLVQDTPYGFIIENVNQFSTLSFSYSLGWNNSSKTWAAGTDSRDKSTTPPPGVAQSSDLGSCRVFIPASSSLKGKGKNGADIGANILYRYKNGALTNEPLWTPTTGAFPCGAIVPGVNDKPGQSCFDVHLRLNVNANGCKLPNGYGGGNSKPVAPNDFTVQ